MQPQENKNTSGPEKMTGTEAGMDKELILVVDDSATVLVFTAATLMKAGYRVETTSDVWIAHLIHRLKPRLLLLDVNMGGARSGTVVVQGINRMSIRKHTRVFFYSSIEEEELANLALRYKVDGYIGKSQDPEKLVRRVGEALAGIRTRCTAA